MRSVVCAVVLALTLGSGIVLASQEDNVAPAKHLPKDPSEWPGNALSPSCAITCTHHPHRPGN